jgi:hypothetical protein
MKNSFIISTHDAVRHSSVRNIIVKVQSKVEVNLEPSAKAQRGSRSTALLFL